MKHTMYDFTHVNLMCGTVCNICEHNINHTRKARYIIYMPVLISFFCTPSRYLRFEMLARYLNCAQYTVKPLGTDQHTNQRNFWLILHTKYTQSKLHPNAQRRTLLCVCTHKTYCIIALLHVLWTDGVFLWLPTVVHIHTQLRVNYM